MRGATPPGSGALRVEPARDLPLVEQHTVSDSWAVNTDAACDIRCAYCITSAQGRSTPRVPPDVLTRRLHDELDAIGEIDRMVVGPYVDVYPGPERRLGLTRRVLEVLAEREHSFMLVTKGTTVVRDADLFHRPGTLIQISLNTVAPATAGRTPAAHSRQRRTRDTVRLDARAGRAGSGPSPLMDAPAGLKDSRVVRRLPPTLRARGAVDEPVSTSGGSGRRGRSTGRRTTSRWRAAHGTCPA